jgi:hypothetical protein
MEIHMTPNITGNHLVNVEELASVSSLTCFSELHESRAGIASTFTHDSNKFPAHAADFEENVRLVITMQRR